MILPFGPTAVLPIEPPRAASAGRLPAPGPLQVGSVELPAGRPVVARDASGDSLPSVLWATDDVVEEATATWAGLVELFPDTGLWPVLLRSLGDDSGRPWRSEDLQPVDESAIDALDPAKVLADAWDGWLVPVRNPWPDGTGPLAPFESSYPGPAPVLPPRDGVRMQAVADVDCRLGLVSCRRPADAVALAGWTGTINRLEAVEVSAVLRSW